MDSARPWSARTVRAGFARWQADHPDRSNVLDPEAIAYVDYHAERYARLLSLVDELGAAAKGPDGLRILDIGPNIQTELLRAAHPGGVVDTLGFAHPAIPPRAHERHLEFDLNQLISPGSGPPVAAGYDIVILAEVVEHLHIPLATVLRCVAGWLRSPGHVLVQTPNGAAFHKRIRLLLGRSPVAPPRETPGNPGHFHEYTLAELRDQVAAAGLAVERLETANHFGGQDAGNRLYRGAGRLLPPTLRHGVTLCVRSTA